MRAELIESMKVLADPAHQRDRWRSNSEIDPNVIDTLSQCASFMFDDADLFRNSASAIGRFLGDETEACALDALMEALEVSTVSLKDERHYDPEEADRILDSANWPEVFARAH